METCPTRYVTLNGILENTEQNQLAIMKELQQLFPCLATKQEEKIQFRLKFETKRVLFLQRFELSLIFPKMTFNQLQVNFEMKEPKP
jgi:hypothetical protein